MITSRSRLAPSTSAPSSSMSELVLSCIAMMVRIEALRSSFSVSSTMTLSRMCSSCDEKPHASVIIVFVSASVLVDPVSACLFSPALSSTVCGW
ncbi:unnamed protein product [Linum trigynum]|uniref:Secreted protein n=1 Tax=Linum trigynum TaxID=586398 RepID=A0AAV2DSC2_9ROSI